MEISDSFFVWQFDSLFLKIISHRNIVFFEVKRKNYMNKVPLFAYTHLPIHYLGLAMHKSWVFLRKIKVIIQSVGSILGVYYNAEADPGSKFQRFGEEKNQRNLSWRRQNSNLEERGISRISQRLHLVTEVYIPHIINI